MNSPSILWGQAEGLPLTFAALMAASSPDSPATHVQVRKHFPSGPVVLCGRVVEISDNNGQWLKVDTKIGTYWIESRNARMCSGDGRCTCEIEAQERRRGRS